MFKIREEKHNELIVLLLQQVSRHINLQNENCFAGTRRLKLFINTHPIG